MKKSFYGYNISETDVMVNTLREENESLNTTITTLKTQLKNNETGSAKANLLEEDLKNREENIRQLQEEKNEFISQITSFTEEAAVLNEQNNELMTQNAFLHQQNELLSRQLYELQQQLAELAGQDQQADTSSLESLRSMLQAEQQYKAALEQALNNRAEELIAVTAELENANSRLEALANDPDKENARKRAEELENAQMEIIRLKDELTVTRLANDEQVRLKMLEKKQQADLNQASEISFRAYYEMSKLRNEVVEYMQEQMKEYYQFVNENSVRMRAAIEQRQAEYNQMIREFLDKASNFRASLSSVENKYSNMNDYSMNIDKLSTRMNEIMNSFLEESDAYLKKKEGDTPLEAPGSEETVSYEPGENISIKPFMRKLSG